MSDRIEISGHLKRDEPSDKAVLFDDGTREVWLPRSQIKIKYPSAGFTLGAPLVEIDMPEWLAREKGLL